MSDMKHNLLLLCAAALAVTACTQDELGNGVLPEGEYPLIINATSPQAMTSPVSLGTVDGDWQGVTSVALSVGGTIKEYNVTASDADGYKTATLSRENDPFWWTSRNDITVSAWWPYDAANISQMPAVKVAADQSTQDAFAGSDFIAALNKSVQFDNPTLEFSHRTARITVNLEKGNGITGVTGADVYVTGLSTDGGNPASISTYASGNDTYEALAAPQTVKANTPFIEVDLNGSTFYFRPQSDVVLTANSRYTYTVRVTAKGLELAGCTITGWTEGGGESGTAEDLGFTYNANTHTYLVYNENGLLAWNEAAQSDLSLNCTLTEDITLTKPATGESNWTPISGYSGTFDGDGHAIDNLTINTTKEKQGLFSTISSPGIVKNLTLRNVQIEGGLMTGGIAGYNFGTITDCKASGNIKGTTTVGGIAGTSFMGSITNCSFDGSVISDGGAAGGISGSNGKGTTTGKGTIINCHSSGSIALTGEGSGESGVGGIVGINNSAGIIIACYSSSTVLCPDASAVGGVVGNNDEEGVVIACYASGDVEGYQNAGGVVGSHEHDAQLIACYATGDVEGGFYGGGSTAGVVGRIYQAIVTACYWSGSETWGSGTRYDDGETTKVNGNDVTWTDAVDGMNAAINEWNASHADQACNWTYQTPDANTPPTLSAK